MDDNTLISRIQAAYGTAAVPTLSARAAMERAESAQRRRQGVTVVGVVLVLMLGAVVWLQASANQLALGWEPIPRPQDPWIIAQAERSCGTGSNPDKSDSGLPLNGGLPTALVDARGRTAIAFFTDGHRFATCEFTWAADGTPLLAAAAEGGALGAGGSLDLITANTDSGGRYHVIAGHVPAGTAEVTVELDGAPVTTASIGNGYYLAWWPNYELITRVVAHGSDGHVLASFVPSD